MLLFLGVSEKTGVTVIQQESTAETPPPDTNQSDCSTQETNQPDNPAPQVIDQPETSTDSSPTEIDQSNEAS